MGKTIKLEVVPQKQQISQDVVEEMEYLLKEIRSGRIVNVAIIAQDRSFNTWFAHYAQNAPCLIGGIEEIKRQILDEWAASEQS